MKIIDRKALVAALIMACGNAGYGESLGDDLAAPMGGAGGPARASGMRFEGRGSTEDSLDLRAKEAILERFREIPQLKDCMKDGHPLTNSIIKNAVALDPSDLQNRLDLIAKPPQIFSNRINAYGYPFTLNFLLSIPSKDFDRVWTDITHTLTFKFIKHDILHNFIKFSTKPDYRGKLEALAHAKDLLTAHLLWKTSLFPSLLSLMALSPAVIREKADIIARIVELPKYMLNQDTLNVAFFNIEADQIIPKLQAIGTCLLARVHSGMYPCSEDSLIKDLATLDVEKISAMGRNAPTLLSDIETPKDRKSLIRTLGRLTPVQIRNIGEHGATLLSEIKTVEGRKSLIDLLAILTEDQIREASIRFSRMPVETRIHEIAKLAWGPSA